MGAPAEAEAERIRTIAKANADSTTFAAEAAAANGRVALDQQLISMLPQISQNLAAGLANANVTILDGASGYNQVVAELGTQAAAILTAVRGAVHNAGGDQQHEHVERLERQGYRIDRRLVRCARGLANCLHG